MLTFPELYIIFPLFYKTQSFIKFSEELTTSPILSQMNLLHPLHPNFKINFNINYNIILPSVLSEMSNF
jgi:hypothetical protein